jgi:hypothetical protein
VLGGSKAGYNPVSPLVDSPTLGLNLVETSGGVGHNTFNPLPTCLVGLIPLRGSQADVRSPTNGGQKLQTYIAYLIISNSLICHQLNTMNETTEKINNIEKPLIQNKIDNKVINEDELKIKEMQLRNINNKYNDL